ncbi:hypothetical protein BH10BAC2_BH10BAC2_42740 [soil metagenome]
MKTSILQTITVLLLLSFSNVSFSQKPDLGAASSFAVFTAAGAFANDGISHITGDVGTNVGEFTGFPPGILIGQQHVADVVSAQAATDVDIAYSYLSGLTCGAVIGTTLGNGQVLTPNIYCLGAASVLNGDLVLDAQGDPDAIFIFKIDGALSTSTFANVVLTNSASLCNVFWQVNGAFALGENAVFRGTMLINGAITLNIGSSLYGRALSRAGRVDIHTATVTINPLPTATIIASDGGTTFCQGGSVTLTASAASSYLWSTGETTQSITVYTSGTYTVTVTEGCGSASASITVTVNPLPDCSISGNTSFCEGGSTQLCAPAGNASYLWSTGATESCITVTEAGTYSVTVTNANGCSSTCSKTVSVNPLPDCTISGNTSFCAGGSTQLCAPAGNASYLWSTGATESCITVTEAGTYTVTVTNANGCSSTCSKTVTVNALPACGITVTGCYKNSICQGQTATLCATAGSGYTYYWSTGETTQCITVGAAGIYTVTITNGNGCTSTCSVKTKVVAAPLVSVINYTNTTKCNRNNGSVTVAGSGGKAPYKYSMNSVSGFKTSTTFSGLAAGTYTVYVKDANNCTGSVTLTISAPAGCNSFSAVSGESALASPDNSLSYNIDTKVLPNPSSTEFTLLLKSDRQEAVEIRVMDMYGKIVHRAKGSVNNAYRFGSRFAAGSYFVQILQNDKIKTIKIIKE